MDLETPAFNRDPAFIGDPVSISTLASSPPAFINVIRSYVPC